MIHRAVQCDFLHVFFFLVSIYSSHRRRLPYKSTSLFWYVFNPDWKYEIIDSHLNINILTFISIQNTYWHVHFLIHTYVSSRILKMCHNYFFLVVLPFIEGRPIEHNKFCTLIVFFYTNFNLFF